MKVIFAIVVMRIILLMLYTTSGTLAISGTSGLKDLSRDLRDLSKVLLIAEDKFIQIELVSAAPLKVSFFQKDFLDSWILPKNERTNSLFLPNGILRRETPFEY